VNDPSQVTLLHRLDRLERINRRWKLLTGAAVGVLGLIVLLGATRSERRETGNTFLVYALGNTYRAEKNTASGRMWQLGYLTGVLDAFSVHTLLAPEEDFAGTVSRCIRNRYQKYLQIGQAEAIVNRYLEARPELWDKAMPTLIGHALLEACQK
jgi:hypothetical protein